MTFLPRALGHSLFKQISVPCVVSVLVLVAVPRTSAQTFHVINVFGGNGTGANPGWSPAVDSFGNVYVTTSMGGIGNCYEGCGLVLKGTPHGSQWIWTYLYRFANGLDGAYPSGPVLLDRAGAVYGVAESSNYGLVYELRPSATRPASAVSPWNETALYAFSGVGTGFPSGAITFDGAGDIFGTTIENNGTVYELTPIEGGWSENTLYTFQGGSDGVNPYYGVTIDSNRNLYGVTNGDYLHCGTVFELANTGSGWIKSTLYQFQGLSDGCHPLGWLTRDSAGNLYGTAYTSPGPSVIYEVSPGTGGGWSFSVIQSFSAPAAEGSLAVDSSGNLYGTVGSGGQGLGSIYKLSHAGDGWMYSSLHDFDPSGAEGQYPQGVTMDSHGNLFGVMTAGGASNDGTVWELTQ